MIYQAILAASIFLLLAFGIERLGRVSGVPSVVILIAVGLAAKPVLALFGLTLEGIDVAVPVIGTVGLVLIVLEGALDIELRSDRLRAAAGAFLMAGGGFIVCTGLFAGAAVVALPATPFQALVLAVPFAVISSAVAIPGSSFLPPRGREFVVYESSLSDILASGFLLAAQFGWHGIGRFSGTGRRWGSVAAAGHSGRAVGLTLILMRIDGHIRFIPLLAGLFGPLRSGQVDASVAADHGAAARPGA